MLDSNIFPLVKCEWCEFVNAFGHSNKLKEGRMPKTKHECFEKCFHLDTSAKNILLRSCIQKYASHTHELIKLKEDLPISLLEKT